MLGAVFFAKIISNYYLYFGRHKTVFIFSSIEELLCVCANCLTISQYMVQKHVGTLLKECAVLSLFSSVGGECGWDHSGALQNSFTCLEQGSANLFSKGPEDWCSRSAGHPVSAAVALKLL